MNKEERMISEFGFSKEEVKKFKEYQSKIMSEKIKKAYTAKAKKGKFMGSFASYGYKRDPEDKNHFIIDEEAAEIVRMIFDLYINGTGQIEIANVLNQQNIPTPSEYKRQQGLNYKNSNESHVNQWTYSTVHKILQNKMLVGDMWQRRNKRGKFDQGGTQYAKDEQIIVSNTHEAIINRENFEFVQRKLLNTRDVSENLKNNVSIYAKHLRCECGHPMAKITNKYKYKDGSSKTVVRYVCRHYKQNSKNCASHSIFEEELNIAILNFINDCFLNIPNKSEIIHQVANSKCDSNKRNEFLSDPLIEQLLTTGMINSLSREIIDVFIDKIIVHNDENNEITLEIIPTFNKPE